jgi:hypothetical protein
MEMAKAPALLTIFQLLHHVWVEGASLLVLGPAHFFALRNGRSLTASTRLHWGILLWPRLLDRGLLTLVPRRQSSRISTFCNSEPTRSTSMGQPIEGPGRPCK